MEKRLSHRSLGLWVFVLILLAGTAPSLAQEGAPLQVTVNSSQDGEVQPDDQLTLREAIAIQNGTLPVQNLSATEQAQVQPAAQRKIVFDLPAGDATIELQSVLPALATPDLEVDGTSQPGYSSAPVVALTPATEAEVFRGLTIVADNVTVKGLSLYGFTSIHRRTASTPPADIFIAHRLPPPDISQQKRPTNNAPFGDRDVPPTGVVIESNWLGLTPEGTMPAQPSAFGISVFNSRGTVIRNNRIANHDGSGIITSVRAENLEVFENQIVANGLAGMPDAIRLEGAIDNSVIRNNLICGNDGSGIFMFKPDGAVQIRDNNIKFNGQRLRRAAVYLMGNDHQVSGNQIRHQAGPGVVVAAYPKSDRNNITNNQFGALEGLSIDLVTRRHVGVSTYQRGDGANVPQRDSGQRRRDTANRAVNTPVFLSQEFLFLDNQVNLDGVADPGAVVTLYKVTEGNDVYGPLSEPLMDITVNDEGRFAATLIDLQPGDRISAIATLTDSGTSEPAQNAIVTSINAEPVIESAADNAVVPNCTPEPVAVQAPTPEIQKPEVIQLSVPRNVHFGLDQDQVMPESMAVLDQIVAILRDYPTITVDLLGHTDSRASQQYNQALAQRRASNVRRYLLQQGIDAARITMRSLGEKQLLTAERNAVDYARNRRVEFIFRDVREVEIVFVNQEQDLQVELQTN